MGRYVSLGKYLSTHISLSINMCLQSTHMLKLSYRTILTEHFFLSSVKHLFSPFISIKLFRIQSLDVLSHKLSHNPKHSLTTFLPFLFYQVLISQKQSSLSTVPSSAFPSLFLNVHVFFLPTNVRNSLTSQSSTILRATSSALI